MGKHDSCGGMAQIVEPQPSDTGPGEERLEAARDAARRDRTTRRSGEDEIIIQKGGIHVSAVAPSCPLSAPSGVGGTSKTLSRTGSGQLGELQ